MRNLVAAVVFASFAGGSSAWQVSRPRPPSRPAYEDRDRPHYFRNPNEGGYYYREDEWDHPYYYGGRHDGQLHAPYDREEKSSPRRDWDAGRYYNQNDSNLRPWTAPRQMAPRRRRSLMDDFFEEPRRGAISPLGRTGLLSPFGMVRRMNSLMDSVMDDVRQSMSAMERALPREQASREALLRRAERLLNDDPACRDALGSPAEVGPVSAQSTSMSYVNGRSRQRTNLQAAVRGPSGGGMVFIAASDGGIEDMILQFQDGGSGYPREIRVPVRGNPNIYDNYEGYDQRNNAERRYRRQQMYDSRDYYSRDSTMDDGGIVVDAEVVPEEEVEEEEQGGGN